MKLKSVQITNFRSIDDSEEFEIDDVTCLVGKNESGKTAILKALHRLRPSIGSFPSIKSRPFSKNIDYPRKRLAQYQEDHGGKEAKVIETKWLLEEQEIIALETEFGQGFLTSNEINVSKYYGKFGNDWIIKINENVIVSHLLEDAHFSASERAQLSGCKSVKDITNKLKEIAEPTEKQTELAGKLAEFRGGSIHNAIIDKVDSYWPRFFYFSQYDMMEGKISVEQMQSENDGESVFLDFLECGGTSLEELKSINQSENLKAKLEATSNSITETVLKYWSQNSKLEVEVDLYAGRSGDPPPFNSGTVVEARIKNNSDGVTLPFAERSAGFIWFFSFLVKFLSLSNSTENPNIIILLDEPGLSLHAKAQADLLKYIEEKLKPKHQVIYTTHSPFMIPIKDIASVRTVEVAEKNGEILGTKVSEDYLEATKDTLFPLQGALGYEITQSLFIGENTLLVEGPSDILYLKAVSESLRRKKKTHLDYKWTICPAGGLDKVHAFVSLFSGNNLNIVVLTDIARGDKKKIEKLKRTEILEDNRILNYANFLDQDEADVEDMFGVALFAEIVSNAYGLEGKNLLDEDKLINAKAKDDTIRLVKKAEAYFAQSLPDIPRFNHFRPADWLFKNPDTLLQDDESVKEILDRFEKLFTKINSFLN